MQNKNLYWARSETPAELYALLETIGADYPLREGRGDQKISFVPGLAEGELEVSGAGQGIVVKYGSLNAAARGLGMALGNRAGQGKIVFKTLGIMLDASRNAVMTVDHFKKWLRQLALMGYNLAMLYTEDTYQLPDEPYFGYMRGPYTMAELKEIDAYAQRLGVEMIGCIQTLGHLEQVLQWSAYDKVRDTKQVLMADEEKTYQLIEKMLAFWNEAFASRRIHIGMDETHDLGRGSFMDKFGYERGFDIFNRHLARVGELSAKHGLRPMIWSDMYFRMGNPVQSYYDVNTNIPDDVKAKIPAGVDLVYWDYYHDNKAFYLDWIQRHRDLNKEPLMGSGIWTWGKLWCAYDYSKRMVIPCLEACRESKLQDVFFTLWGDDGAYCEFDSALAGLCQAAEWSFGHDCNEKDTAALFDAVCGADYRMQVKAGELEECYPTADYNSNSANWMWDDPLMGKYQREVADFSPTAIDQIMAHYEKLAAELPAAVEYTGGGDVTFARQTAVVLADKIKLRRKLLSAYHRHDSAGLKELAERDIPAMTVEVRRWEEMFRTQWLRRNKPFGMDVIQMRIGGQLLRWEELRRWLVDYVQGKVKAIPELEISLPGQDGKNPDWGGWSKWGISSRSIW